MIASAAACPLPPDDPLHLVFLALLPRLQAHAYICFGHIKCPARKEDAVQEMLGLAWTWLVRLNARGKDVCRFPGTFTVLVARAVRSGRRVCGQEKARDVLSPLARQRHHFKVESLPTSIRTPRDHLYSSPLGQERQDAFEDRLRDNTVTPVPDQVQFRIDFPAWLKTLTARERRIIKAMARNERTKDLSKTFEVSPGRISQMRREFCEGWKRFCGDHDDDAESHAGGVA
jgi:hypothetical protein